MIGIDELAGGDLRVAAVAHQQEACDAGGSDAPEQHGDLVPLPRLAVLLIARNDLDRQIAELIGHPITTGHLGECIGFRSSRST